MRKPEFSQAVAALAIPVCQPESPRFEDVADDFRSILDSGVLTAGPYLEALEEEVAAHLGCRHAVAVSSCTMGLMLTLRSLGLTGEAVLPSFTFCATAAAVVWAGLKPVFVDSDRRTFNVDPAAVDAAITARTSAIIATHVFGNPAQVASLEHIASTRGIALVFDAAHGFGSRRRGQPLGCGGNAEVFSCSPTKLVVAGEGGIITTNDPDLARSLRVAREYGNPGDYNCTMVGTNARLSELHAALGRVSLRSIEETSLARNRIARQYRQALSGVPGISFQHIPTGSRSSYKDFAVVVDEAMFGRSRNELALRLAAEGIDTRAYYCPPVHAQHAFVRYVKSGAELPVATWLSERVLCLPIYRRMAGLVEHIVDRVCSLQQTSGPGTSRGLEVAA